MVLDRFDLNFSVNRLPASLKKIMMEKDWWGKIFVGGGYVRAIVSGEKINDIDVFVPSPEQAELLAHKLAPDKKDIIKTKYAYTVKGKLPIQIIHRWVFNNPQDVALSFDFTICCAIVYFRKEESDKAEKWNSFCDDRFYIDVAAKRLVYRSPVRNEDAGGSILRVLKYYQRGYRIPLDSLGAVIARLMRDYKTEHAPLSSEKEVAHVITGLLREVDPNIDPNHISHLPSSNEIEA